LSETVEFDTLLNEKSSVENEGRTLDEEQKQLAVRAKVLTRKIIEELRIRNHDKRESVNQLQSTVHDLESQLNALAVSTVQEDTVESVESSEEPVEAAAMEAPTEPEEIVEPVAISEEPQEAEEAAIAPLEEPVEEAAIPTQEPQEPVEVEATFSATEVTEEIEADSRSKKKRRFF